MGNATFLETKIIDANNVDLLHTFYPKMTNDDDTIENLGDSG